MGGSSRDNQGVSASREKGGNEGGNGWMGIGPGEEGEAYVHT